MAHATSRLAPQYKKGRPPLMSSTCILDLTLPLIRSLYPYRRLTPRCPRPHLTKTSLFYSPPLQLSVPGPHHRAASDLLARSCLWPSRINSPRPSYPDLGCDSHDLRIVKIPCEERLRWFLYCTLGHCTAPRRLRTS